MVMRYKYWILGLCGFALIVHLMSRPLPELAIVDIAGITEKFVKQEARKKLPDEEHQKAVKVFSHALEHALEKVAKTHSLILFPKEAVLKGGKDYTHEVEMLMLMEL
jgi:hypothetical protein